MSKGIPTREPTNTRVRACLVAVLSVVVLGFTLTATSAGAGAQGIDDTAAGCLDQSGLGGPVDEARAADVATANPGACATTGTDPDAGPAAALDDTPVGELDTTDLGEPIDDTDGPAAEARPPFAGDSHRRRQGSKTPRKSPDRSTRRSRRRQGHRRVAEDRAPPALSSSLGDAPTSVSQALPGAAAIGVPNFFIDKFRIPPFLLPIYQAAGIEYGVRWEILAGINEIETDYGRNLNVSSAGALGWMQFMPATWKQYGVDANHDGKKDPFNPVDAIFAAARYLKAAGADTDIRRAVFAYNHADWYVDSVLMRARLIGGLPSDLVGSLTGLTQGHFPVSAKATYADDRSEREIDIYAKAGSPVIAVQDGTVVRMGRTGRLGAFIALRDVFGNTYTYGHLKTLSVASRRERAAGAGRKMRLFANPGRPGAYVAGGEEQLLTAGGHDLERHGVALEKLRLGSDVPAGTVLGRIGRTGRQRAPHLRFEIRPAGRGTPRIDPRPILDGWKLLESAAFRGSDVEDPSIGQILLMGKEELRHRVLTDPSIDIYDCGRRDIEAGDVDRRVLATLELLAAGGLEPTVSAFRCGHGPLTSSGNVSEHSTGDAVDIAAINGIPILGHQGPGSITDVTIRRLLMLQGAMKPHQIISLMTFAGADNTLALPDHADHIHVGFQSPADGGSQGLRRDSALRPSQWPRLIDRLGAIDNPAVPVAPKDADTPSR
jgi:hypothetical protein